MGVILQFSDVHFGCEHKQAVAAASHYAHAQKPDLILITGDITQSGLKPEFEAAARWIKSLPEPVFVTVGNHDVPYWDVLARLFWPWKAFEKATGHRAHDHAFTKLGLMVRGVTTARGWQARLNWSKGVIDLEQTARAAEALRQTSPDTLRILACHHPLVEMIDTPMTGAVKRGDRAARIFAEAGVDLITTGHVHVPFALPIDMSERRCYAIGCGTLSLRERDDYPPSFNRIEWDEKLITVTVVKWVGTGFVDGEHWVLKRRQDTRDSATAPNPDQPGPLEQDTLG